MSSTAPPAHPILASTLYDIHIASSIEGTGRSDAEAPRKRRRLQTGFRALDREVLNGGLVYGEGGLVCLSVGAEEKGGGRGGGGSGGGRRVESRGEAGEDVGEEVGKLCCALCFVM